MSAVALAFVALWPEHQPSAGERSRMGQTPPTYCDAVFLS
jgi:hypothetical protein